MNEGWIKMYRKITDWEWYGDINVCRVFTHLLFTCNFVDKRWRGCEVKSGEKITSIANLGKETGLSPQQVRTALDKLESTNEITRRPQANFTLIKLNKWGDYQESNKLNNKQITNEQQTDNKRVTTTKEGKNERMQEATTKALEISKILLCPSDRFINSIEDLIRKYDNTDLVVVAQKCVVYEPFDKRWLKFVAMSGSEFEDKNLKAKNKYSNLPLL